MLPLRPYYILKQLTLTVLTSLILLGIIEGVLRLHLNETDENLSVVDSYGLKLLKPNLDTTVLGGADVPVRIKTNSLGFASPEYSVPAPTGTERIAFLGNSFTKGFEVDFDNKFTSLVEQKLNTGNTNPKSNYQIFNFAQGGFTLIDQQIVYEKYVRQFKPDIVIAAVYMGYDIPSLANDVANREKILNTLNSQLILPASASTPPESLQTVSGLKNKLKQLEIIRHTIRFIIERPRLHRFAARLGLLNKPLTKNADNYLNELPAYLTGPAQPQDSIITFAVELLNKLGARVQADGSKFVIILIPSHWQVDSKFRNQLPQFHSATDVLLYPQETINKKIGNKFPILDLSTDFAIAIDDSRQQIFVRDVGHLTAFGHQLTADLITKFLKKEF